jgi:hypothetical protein
MVDIEYKNEGKKIRGNKTNPNTKQQNQVPMIKLNWHYRFDF